jgi:hypothetical protein
MVPQPKIKRSSKRNHDRNDKPMVIGPSTPYEFTSELLTPFGGFLLFVKMLAALQFEKLFDETFAKPGRTPMRGHYFMFKGLIFLLVIGFQRIFHFSYISHEPMLLSVLAVAQLPAVTTFWRWLRYCGINQANSLVKLMALVRERVWWQVGYAYPIIHIDIDTTVETVYGDVEGARKGYNPKHRGKKGLRPVLAFIAETKEYLAGKLRQGTTMSGDEVTTFIKSFKPLLPGCVVKVIIRADSEFFSQDAVTACEEEKYRFIISVKVTDPPFVSNRWYSVRGRPGVEYNSSVFKPPTWDKAYRFVVMRILQTDTEKANPQQTELLNEPVYKYRIFVTDLKGSAHRVIDIYDKRAGAENLIGEAKREGLCAIPSKMFHTNMAFFQMVMLTYNLWRHLQAFAEAEQAATFRRHTVHVARLKVLFIAAKIVRHSDQVKVKYSDYLDIRPQLEKLFKKLDCLLQKPSVWDKPIAWITS